MNIQRLSRSHRRRIFGGYNRKVMAYGPIAYWPLWEAAGSVAECLVNPAQNGTYVGVTLGQNGIGDGNTAPFFDGTNDYVDCGTATLYGAFKPDIGTALVWCKVNAAAVWTDGISRQAIFTQYNNINYLMLKKDNEDNRAELLYKADGTTKPINITSYSNAAWFVMAVTWDKGNDQEKGFIDGVQQGPTQTGLGTWNPANAIIRFLIGAYNTTPIQAWHGWLAHAALWDRVLSPAAMLDLSTV